jgi:hypothetical protein
MMYDDGVGLNSIVTLHDSLSPADNTQVYAGQELLTYDNVNYAGYCVDILHWSGTCEMTPEPISSIHNGDLVAYLYETYSPQVHDGTTAAALGVAIWETVFETDPGPLNATKGACSISGNDAVASAANAMLATMPQSYKPSSDETILYNGSSQSFLIQADFTPSPEPTTVALLAVGGVFAAIRRRKS